MLAKSLPESYWSWVFWTTLAALVENMNGAGFGVGILDVATAAIAFEN